MPVKRPYAGSYGPNKRQRRMRRGAGVSVGRPFPSARSAVAMVGAAGEKQILAQTLAPTFASISTTWTEYVLNAIVSGSAYGQRRGRTVLIHSVYLRGTLVGGQTNLATDDRRNTVRLVIATYAGSGTTPLTGAGATLSTPIQPGVFGGTMVEKYCDRSLALQTPGSDGTGYLPAMLPVTAYHKFRQPLRVNFSDNGGGGPDFSVIVSCLSDSLAVPNPGFVDGYMSVAYSDV